MCTVNISKHECLAGNGSYICNLTISIIVSEVSLKYTQTSNYTYQRTLARFLRASPSHEINFNIKVFSSRAHNLMSTTQGHCTCGLGDKDI